MTSARRQVMAVTDDPDDQQSELRSFGRRRGRRLSERQQQLLDRVLPRIRAAAEVEASDIVLSDCLASLTRNAAKPVWLEIGFGGGEHFIWQARNNPSVTLIGCEPFVDGIVKVLSETELNEIDNIFLHDDDVRPLLRAMPRACIDRAFILFPDPWPKKRHMKRRLISRSLLDLLACALKPGAELRVATDIPDYSRTLLRSVLDHEAFRWAARSNADWRFRAPDWPETRYEQKAVREGRQSCYYRFERL